MRAGPTCMLSSQDATPSRPCLRQPTSSRKWGRRSITLPPGSKRSRGSSFEQPSHERVAEARMLDLAPLYPVDPLNGEGWLAGRIFLVGKAIFYGRYTTLMTP